MLVLNDWFHNVMEKRERANQTINKLQLKNCTVKKSIIIPKGLTGCCALKKDEMNTGLSVFIRITRLAAAVALFLFELLMKRRSKDGRGSYCK